MFIPGLCAISFRKNSIQDIARAASDAGLKTIEWGSDISVPTGDPLSAKEAAILTSDFGLSSPSYGSYFRLGVNKLDELLPLFENARILGSRVLRIWGYNRFVTPEEKDIRDILVSEARAAADIAASRGITLALECHNKTITEHYENALAFLSDVGRDNLRMYWQPNHLRSYEYNIESIRALAPYVEVIHAFNWDSGGRYPLALGRDTWREYLRGFSECASLRDIPVLLEFMPDGEISSLKGEAETLINILEDANRSI